MVTPDLRIAAYEPLFFFGDIPLGRPVDGAAASTCVSPNKLLAILQPARYPALDGEVAEWPKARPC